MTPSIYPPFSGFFGGWLVPAVVELRAKSGPERRYAVDTAIGLLVYWSIGGRRLATSLETRAAVSQKYAWFCLRIFVGTICPAKYSACSICLDP